jgi:hypothetical protein
MRLLQRTPKRATRARRCGFGSSHLRGRVIFSGVSFFGPDRVRCRRFRRLLERPCRESRTPRLEIKAPRETTLVLKRRPDGVLLIGIDRPEAQNRRPGAATVRTSVDETVLMQVFDAGHEVAQIHGFWIEAASPQSARSSDASSAFCGVRRWRPCQGRRQLLGAADRVGAGR